MSIGSVTPLPAPLRALQRPVGGMAGLGLARQKRGQGMSITGLVLGVIGLLGAIGS